MLKPHMKPEDTRTLERSFWRILGCVFITTAHPSSTCVIVHPYLPFLVMVIAIHPDFVTNAEIYENEIEDCGLYDYRFDSGGGNGEGICESLTVKSACSFIFCVQLHCSACRIFSTSHAQGYWSMSNKKVEFKKQGTFKVRSCCYLYRSHSILKFPILQKPCSVGGGKSTLNILDFMSKGNICLESASGVVYLVIIGFHT